VYTSEISTWWNGFLFGAFVAPQLPESLTAGKRG